MAKTILFAIASLLVLSACETTLPRLGPDGRPLQVVYRITVGDTAKIQFRVLDSINALRTASGQTKLNLNSQLNAAAETHSRDMSVQNRPWHFGSDGSSPLDRVDRVGYPGQLIGENISETYENEIATLAAWLDLPNTRNVILSPKARNLGFSWYQQRNGKIWWTLVTGS